MILVNELRLLQAFIPFDCILHPFRVDTPCPNRQHHHPIRLLRDILCHLSVQKRPLRVKLSLPKTPRIDIGHLRCLVHVADPLEKY